MDEGAAGFIEKGLPPIDLLDRLSRLLLVSADRPESVSEFLGSTRTFAPAAVAFDTDPSTLQRMALVLANCGFRIVTQVVSRTDVIGSLQSAVYMTRPAVVVVGEGGPTEDLITSVELQSPRTPIVVYTSESLTGPDHGVNARVVARPNYELLERTIREAGVVTAAR